jgi:tRNA(adenine34) deaminase
MHAIFLQHAIKLAKKAEREGEVPIGAVVVFENKIIGEGWNQCISLCDPTAHAEMIALREAGKYLKNYRFIHTTLYTTLEPCLMCANAMIHARIANLIFGAFDLKNGAVSSQVKAFDLPYLNHKIHWEGGRLEKECGQLLREFFKSKRS